MSKYGCVPAELHETGNRPYLACELYLLTPAQCDLFCSNLLNTSGFFLKPHFHSPDLGHSVINLLFSLHLRKLLIFIKCEVGKSVFSILEHKHLQIIYMFLEYKYLISWTWLSVEEGVERIILCVFAHLFNYYNTGAEFWDKVGKKHI